MVEVEEEGKASGLGIKMEMPVLNLPNKPANTLFPRAPMSLTLPWADAPSPRSSGDDYSDLCFHSFLTTLSLIETSAPGFGVSARSGRSDYNMRRPVEIEWLHFRRNFGFYWHPFIINPSSLGDTVI